MGLYRDHSSDFWADFNSTSFTVTDHFSHDLLLVEKSIAEALEKPIVLIDRLINLTTDNSNDIVLDLFAGTGVVAKSCKKTIGNIW